MQCLCRVSCDSRACISLTLLVRWMPTDTWCAGCRWVETKWHNVKKTHNIVRQSTGVSLKTWKTKQNIKQGYAAAHRTRIVQEERESSWTICRTCSQMAPVVEKCPLMYVCICCAVCVWYPNRRSQWWRLYSGRSARISKYSCRWLIHRRQLSPWSIFSPR